jgi:DNA polymerase-3 subunit beta
MTQFAITAEDTRFFLNGALLVLSGSSIELVGTDGHRLAHVTAARPGDKGTGGDLRIILPRKLLSELSRLLTEDGEDVVFERSENHLFFQVGGRTLFSRMIDAQFPAYERVIPKSNDKRIDFDRDRLTSAVRRVAILSNERSRAVKFDINSGRVEITSNSQEFGEAKETLLVDYDGTALQICFNAQYVLDFLAVVQTDTVTLEFKDEMSQAVMKPGPSENGIDYLYVLMPMRL